MENHFAFEEVDDTYFLIGELTAFSNRFQAVADRFFEDISWKQCFVLICIKMFQEQPTINELSAALGSSHQNVKQLLLKLQKTGYIEFIQDAKDKRKQRIIRTPKAEEFDLSHAELSHVYMKRFFEGIDPGKLKTTIETLMQLEQNLKIMEKDTEEIK